MENVRATMVAISNLKPEVIKGKYISQVRASSRLASHSGEPPTLVARVDIPGFAFPSTDVTLTCSVNVEKKCPSFQAVRFATHFQALTPPRCPPQDEDL